MTRSPPRGRSRSGWPIAPSWRPSSPLGDVDRVPLILDVDTGIDDSLALLYAAASPEAELVAVTCLPGNAALEDVARNTRAVLELAGRGDVEVAAGGHAPLRRALEVTPETHGPRGIGYAELPEPTRPLSPRPAAQLVVDEARRRPGEITLVTLGPMSTLARALELEPDLPRLLHRWVSMGGAFRVPGNTTPVSEWNVHCDPDAAQTAFAAWQAAVVREPSTRRALAVGLDATERARIGTDHVVALARRARSTPDDSLDATRPPGAGASRAIPSCCSLPMRSASTSSSTRATTASTGRSSTIRWSSRRHWTRRSSRRRPSPSTWTSRAGWVTGRRSPTSGACGDAGRTWTSP